MPTFFQSFALTKPVTQEARNAAMAVISQAERTLGWTGSLQGQAGLIFNAGGWPLAASSQDVSSIPAQQAQWLQFRNAYAPLSDAALKGEMDVARAAGEQLAANVAFWNSVYRVDAAIATAGLSEAWDSLVEHLNNFKAARAATAASIAAIQQTATDPKYATTPLGAQAKNLLATLTAQQNDIVTGATRALGPLAGYAEVKQEAGLGYPVWMGEAVAATAVVAATTAFIYYEKRQYDLQTQANDNAQEVLKQRNAIDIAAYNAGKITLSQLNNSLDSNNKIANETAKAQGTVGGGSMKWILGGLGAAAVIGLGIYLWRKRRSA